MNKNLLACWLIAATLPAPALELEVGATHENLSQGRADWQSIYLEAEHRFGERRVFYAALRHTERFDQEDSDWLAGLYHPLDRRWTLNGEIGGSPTHRVLPESSAALNLHRQLDDGWGLAFGGRVTAYSNADTATASFGLERYFGAYRAAYTFTTTHLAGASDAPSHRLQLNHYYREHDTVGISLSRGEEIENVPPGGILETDVAALALTGRHWLDRDWALSYELLHHEQGSVYRRAGLRLGLRRAF
jgi:YaiO family outer membrane protein